MPDGIVEAVEEVQEHWANVARSFPIGRCEIRVDWLVCIRINGDKCTIISFGVSVSATPDCHGEDEKDAKRPSSTDRTSDPWDIHGKSVEKGPNDLGEVVEKVVQGLGAGVEVSTVDTVLLVGCEPIGGPEHGEQENDHGFVSNGLPKTNELGLPTWVFHQNDLGSIGADNIIGVAEKQGEACPEEHKNDEGNVSAVPNCFVFFDMDVLPDGDLS